MSKVDKDTRTELRRLVTLPGHDRMGLIAKGCISDLLNELETLEGMLEGFKNGTMETVAVCEICVSRESEKDIKLIGYLNPETLEADTPWDTREIPFADWSSEEKEQEFDKLGLNKEEEDKDS